MIYQLDEQIERLLEDFTDPETGELKKYILGHDGEPREVPMDEQLDAEASGVQLPYLDSEKMLMEKMEQLQLDYAKLIRNLRNEHINLVAPSRYLPISGYSANIEKHFCASRILQPAASLTCCKVRRLFSKACSSTT